MARLRTHRDTGALALAVDVSRWVVASASTARGDRLSDLGTMLIKVFETNGDPAVLDEAILNGRLAVAQPASGSFDRGARLANLGLALVRRFERTDDLESLDEAIHVTRSAPVLPPSWVRGL